MVADVDINSKEITNLKEPHASDTDHAANVNFVNTARQWQITTQQSQRLIKNTPMIK